MKYIALLCLLPLVAFGQQVTSQPVKITADKNYPAISIIGSTNQVASYLTLKNENGTILTITSNGVISSGALTNQLVFASTNNAPATTNAIVVWVSVKVVGDTNAYRLPLYK